MAGTHPEEEVGLLGGVVRVVARYQLSDEAGEGTFKAMNDVLH